MVAEIQGASRQLAKKQLAWFRGDALFQWLDAERPAGVIADEIAASVAEPQHQGEYCASAFESLPELLPATLALAWLPQPRRSLTSDSLPACKSQGRCYAARG